MEEPFLVVEVLSPSTRRDDLGVKVVGYQEVSTIREIWAVDSERRWLRVWRRSGDDWIEPLPVRAGAFRSEVLDGDVTLDELYAGTSL
jgi:Uma2 family endonuclease